LFYFSFPLFEWRRTVARPGDQGPPTFPPPFFFGPQAGFCPMWSPSRPLSWRSDNGACVLRGPPLELDGRNRQLNRTHPRCLPAHHTRGAASEMLQAQPRRRAPRREAPYRLDTPAVLHTREAFAVTGLGSEFRIPDLTTPSRPLQPRGHSHSAVQTHRL